MPDTVRTGCDSGIPTYLTNFMDLVRISHENPILHPSGGTNAMTTTTHIQLDIAPLSGTIGAEIRGLDLHQSIDAETLTAVRQALLDYKVIFFPGAHLDPPEHKAFASLFGPITEAHPVIPGIEDHKEVFEIDYTRARELYKASKRASEYGDRERWHTDVTFVEEPPLGSILNAIVIPPAGGDTLWADTQAAYEGLSEPTRRARRQQVLRSDPGHPRPARVERRDLHRAGLGRAPGRAHPPRNRTQEPLREPRLHQIRQGPHGQGERRAPGLPLRPHDDAGIRRALPLGGGRPRLLGQPHDHALRHRRLRRRPPRHPARDDQGRPPLLTGRRPGSCSTPPGGLRRLILRDDIPPPGPTRPWRNDSHPRRLVTAALLLAGLAVALPAGAASARTTKTVSLAGVTITFGDQLKGIQTVFAATDALKGAPYTVDWANFVGGPPVIAAATSGAG